MSAYQKPVEDLSVFNSAVFDEANTESLSLSKAQSLFLGRTGNATSVATTTKFTNDIYANDVRIGRGGGVASTNCTLGGTIGTTSNNCTSVGNTATTTNSFATSIGAESQALNNYSTALGYAASATGANSTAIGQNSSASANQISLGTSTETVLCKGTASNTSLIATSNITVAGLTVGTSNASLYPGAVGNTLFGVSAGTAINNATADHNTLIGNTAGVAITSGARNTAVGFASLNANQTSSDNTAVGYFALNKCTSSVSDVANTAVGANCLANITGNGWSTAVGVNALINATGTGNAAFGANAGVDVVAGSDNIFIGADNKAPLNNNKIISGTKNIFVGQSPICAGNSTTSSIILGHNSTITGNFAVAIGFQASAGANQISLGTSTETVLCKGTASNTSLIATSNITVAGLTVGTSNASLYPGAVGNTLFGVSAGTAINNAAADHNTLIGNTAGVAITSGARNTAVGFESLNANQTSNDNTAVGYNALKLYKGQTSFTASTAFGSNALSKLETGGYACAFGTNALLNATGTSNNGFGANAGAAVTTGIANIFIGGDYAVGASPANGNKISTGDNNVFIGQEPICASTTTSNSIILGTKCTITGSNAVAIGYQVSAGANEIVLGGTGQTVLAKGTGTSITASGAISAAGAITTTSVGGMSARVYNLDEYNATANTPYIGALLQQGSAGSIRIYNDKAGGTTPVATQLYISTMTAAKASVDSMVIKSTDIQMNLPITLQSTYSAVAGAGQLGQVVSSTSTSFSVTTATAVSFASFTSLPAGVWAFSYTIDLTTAGGTVTATIQSLYMTLTNGGDYSTKVTYGGSTRTHNNIVYAIGDNPCFSSALTYSITSATSFYPTFLISFTGAGATITANGYATATRIG